MDPLNEQLRAGRKKIGLTQRQVAQRLEMTLQTVHNIETGKTVPRVQTLWQFAELYGCVFVIGSNSK